MISRAWRFVPTNRSVPLFEESWRTNFIASRYITIVFSGLMMWILLRWPKMKGAIFGLHYRDWWPKCTPASSIWRNVVDMNTPVRFNQDPPPAKDPESTGHPNGRGGKI